MKRQRRRLAVPSVTAAALLAGAALLTGCSMDSHPGAAAVVGEDNISVSEVQAHVEAVREAQRAQPNADELISVTGGLTRQTVSFLVYLSVVEQAAEEHGVSATRREIQQIRAESEEFAGGRKALELSALMPQQGGLPLTADQIDEVLRLNVLQQKLAGLVGQDQLTAVLEETSNEIGVDINPRYGRWNASAVTLAEARMPWLNQAKSA